MFARVQTWHDVLVCSAGPRARGTCVYDQPLTNSIGIQRQQQQQQQKNAV